MTNIEKIESVAKDAGWEVRRDYSGRGMFGKTCVGIVCRRPIMAIEFVAELGVRGAKIDDMGLDSIVYWPAVTSDQTDTEPLS